MWWMICVTIWIIIMLLSDVNIFFMMNIHTMFHSISLLFSIYFYCIYVQTEPCHQKIVWYMRYFTYILVSQWFAWKQIAGITFFKRSTLNCTCSSHVQGYQHIEARTKMATIGWQHFLVHFIEPELCHFVKNHFPGLIIASTKHW